MAKARHANVGPLIFLCGAVNAANNVFVGLKGKEESVSQFMLSHKKIRQNKSACVPVRIRFSMCSSFVAVSFALVLPCIDNFTHYLTLSK